MCLNPSASLSCYMVVKAFLAKYSSGRGNGEGAFIFYLFSLRQGCGGCGLSCAKSVIVAVTAWHYLPTRLTAHQAAASPARTVCWLRSDLPLFLSEKSCT